jgi:hypothetical protein
MRYTQMGIGSAYPYPSHDVDPAKKDADWCKEYAKAVYYDFTFAYPLGVFANNNGNYEKFRMYALGKQPLSPYKKLLGVDSQTNHTWLSVDWSVRAVVSGYRDKAISRLMKDDFGVVCTPVDMLAKSEMEDYYNQLRIKLIMREQLQQQNPEMANHPALSLNPNDPMDLEELEMRLDMDEQFIRSKDAEMAIELAFYENDYKAYRRSVFEDLFDYGVAGCKDWLGDDGKAYFRRVNPECVVTSYCKDATFKDIVHAGEVIDVSLVELATIKDENGNPRFTEEELHEFAGSIAGKFGNPAQLGKGTGWFKTYDRFKCKVLDLEFFTYNENVYRESTDESGNIDFRKADYNRGKKSDKYKRKRVQYVYKCKWIIGTDKVYDWGMAYDQKRKNDTKKKAKTRLSYSFCAYNFYEMKAQSFMERLIPYIDDYQLTMLKIQNFKNRAVPSGWWIDLDALEKVALNKGGSNMQPKELLQMFYETGILVGRSVTENGEPQSPNWKPIIPIENTAAGELSMFYQDLMNSIGMIEKITGYNDVTSGNPNPKTLVPGYQMAEQATTDALYPMAYAEEHITLQLAENCLVRIQQGIKKGGNISGYAPALNSNTLKFIEIAPDIALRDYGIEIERRTSNDQKAWLLQQMQVDIQNGLLDTSDAVLLVNTKNVKQAQMIWAHRVKKAKERIQQQELQKIQANNEGQQQSAMAAQQMAAQQRQMEMQFELQKEQMKLQAELEKERMKIESMERIATFNNQTKITVAQETGDAKVNSHVLQGNASIEKQKIANQKTKI